MKKLYFYVLFPLIFSLFALKKIFSYDIWWHLATGRWIWQNKTVPFEDIFSYTHSGKEWIDFAWGFQAMLYPLYRMGGYEALVVFKAFVLLLAFFFLYKALRVCLKSNLLVFTLLMVTLLASFIRFSVRPHIFSFLFMAIFIYLLLLYRERKGFRYLLSLLPIYLLWVNIHGSFIMGYFIVSMYFLGELFEKRHVQLKDVWRIREIREPFLFILCLIGITFINPYTYKLPYFVLFSHGPSASEAIYKIQEWRGYPIKGLFYFNLDDALWWKILFWGFVVIFLANINQGFRTKKVNFLLLADTVIFLAFAYLSIKHFRFSALFAIAVTPFIAYWGKDFLTRRGSKIVVAGIMLLVLYGVAKNSVLKSSFYENFGLGVNYANYPYQVTRFIKTHPLKGRIFNSYGFGGFLIWNLYPEYQVFIDGRTPTVYPVEFYWKFRITEAGNISAFEKFQKQFGITAVFTRVKAFAKKVIEEKGWKMIAFDDKGYLLVAPDNVPEGVKPFNRLKPGIKIRELIKDKDETFLREVEAELKRALEIAPESVKINGYLGVFYDAKGNFQEAVRYFKRCIDLKPSDYIYYYDVGFVYKKMNKPELAIEYLKRAIKLNKKHSPSYLNLGILYNEKKQYKRAVKVLKKYLEIMSDRAPMRAYVELSDAYYNLYEPQRAEYYMRRALFLADTPESMAEAYYNLGNINVMKADYEKAKHFYSKALEYKPGYKEAEENLRNLEKLKTLF